MELLEDLKLKAQEEARDNEKKITDYLQGLIDNPIKVDVNCNDGREVYLTVKFLGAEGEKYWAADVSISYESKYDFDLKKRVDPVLRMDSSSSGLTSRQENPGKVLRAEFMYKLWQHEPEFTQLLNTLPHNADKEYTDAWHKHQAEEQEQARLAEVAKRAQVFQSLAPGLTYEDTHLQESYTIQKITPARVYVQRRSLNVNYRGKSVFVYDCYISKELLIDQLAKGYSIFQIGSENFCGKAKWKWLPLTDDNLYNRH